MASFSEIQPLLSSTESSPQEARKSLGSRRDVPTTTDSSGVSLRFFKTKKSTLPTVWTSPPTDSYFKPFEEILVRKKSIHGSQTEISSFQFFMQILRSSVGTGVLALPSAVANAGLLFGMVGITLVALVIIHSVNLLVESAQFLRHRHGLYDFELDYGCTVEYAFVFGARRVRKFRWMSKILNLSLSITQFGIAVIYVLFVSENVKYLVDYFAPTFNQPLIVYVGFTTAAVFPLIFIRSIRFLSSLSGVGNMLMVVCMTFMLIYCLQDLPPISNYPLITDINRIPLFFGVAVFSFESINVVLPSENALRDKDSLLGWNGLLNLSFTIVLALYLAITFYGYVKFGEGVEGSLTYSLPLIPWYSMIVKPMYAILITMSFGLQYYIMVDVMWQGFTSVVPESFQKTWINCVFRILLLFIVSGLAVGVPYIEHLISLVGALSGSAICLIFPALTHTIVFWDQSYKFHSFRLTMTKNVLIIVFGIFGAIIGTYTSMVTIIQVMQYDLTSNATMKMR